MNRFNHRTCTRLFAPIACLLAAIGACASDASAQYEIDLSLEGPTSYVAVGEIVQGLGGIGHACIISSFVGGARLNAKIVSVWNSLGPGRLGDAFAAQCAAKRAAGKSADEATRKGRLASLCH